MVVDFTITDTSRGQKWLNNYDLKTREEAESFLGQKGENPNSIFWTQVLDALYPEQVKEKEEPIIGDVFPPEPPIDEGEEEREEDLNVLERAGRFIRRLLRGLEVND